MSIMNSYWTKWFRLTVLRRAMQGNKDIFLELFEQNVKSIIRGNPEMLYKHYWISGGSN